MFTSHEGNAEEVEALACREGLALAAEWCRQKVILASDCSSVVELLATRQGLWSVLKFIVDEAVQEGRRLPEWKVIHTKRV